MLKLTCALLLTLFTFIGVFAQKITIVKNTNYISVIDGKLIPNVHIIIAADGSTSILSANQPIKQKNATIINGKGKYLMQAITDMHIHWPETLEKEYFELCEKAGIGNIRVMGSLPQAITYKNKSKVQNFEVGFPIRNNSFFNATVFVDSIKNAGYDFIKIFNIKSQADFIALAKAAQMAKLPICGHALSNINMDTLFSYGYKSVEHVGYLEKLKGGALDSAIQKFKQYDVAVCPTLDWMNMAYHGFNKDSFSYRAGYKQGMAIYKTNWDTTYINATKSFGADESKYASFAKNTIANKLIILKKLHQAGVNIIVGSDAEEPYQTPGFSLIEELLLIEKAGFSTMELLQMATINATKYFKNTNSKIPTNRNYILLTKNPIENIRNLSNVEKMIMAY